MSKNKSVKVFLFIFFVIILILTLIKFIKLSKKDNSNRINQFELDIVKDNEQKFYSNSFNNINYVSEDKKGNKYILNAKLGEIENTNSEIIFLKDIKASIELKNSKMIYIVSDFGKYNINNNDTIFSKNVIVSYLDNQINSDYLDFSLTKNKMIFSKNVNYKNNKINLKADVIDADIKTNNLKIFMHENKKKVMIKN